MFSTFTAILLPVLYIGINFLGESSMRKSRVANMVINFDLVISFLRFCLKKTIQEKQELYERKEFSFFKILSSAF